MAEQEQTNREPTPTELVTRGIREAGEKRAAAATATPAPAAPEGWQRWPATDQVALGLNPNHKGPSGWGTPASQAAAPAAPAPPAPDPAITAAIAAADDSLGKLAELQKSMGKGGG